MFELIKKGLLAGLGAAVLTKEKIEKVTRKLVDEGTISLDQAEKLSKDLLEGGKTQWEELQNKITSTVKKAVENLDPAGRKDLEKLKERIVQLERRVAAMEDSHTPGEE